MPSKLIKAENLSSDYFIVDDKTQDIKVKMPVKQYVGTVIKTNGFDYWTPSNTASRFNAMIQATGFGQIHVDIKRTSTHQPSVDRETIGTLPLSCPTPRSLIEVQAWDGAVFFIKAGERNVYCNMTQPNVRYVVNLTGYFVVEQ